MSVPDSVKNIDDTLASAAPTPVPSAMEKTPRTTDYTVHHLHAGRRFRILFCSNGKWHNGKVVHFKHYETLGNLQQSHWELVADIEPSPTLAKGVLVQHKDWLPGEPFLVDRMEDPPTAATTTTSRCTLLTPSGRLLPRQQVEKLTLVGGRFEFALVKLNTQGGATLRSCSATGRGTTLLSLEWIEPASEPPNRYLDLSVLSKTSTQQQLVTTKTTTTPPDLAASRAETLRELTRSVCEQRREFAGVSLMAVGQRLYHPLVSSLMRDPVKLRETLLTLPFVLFNPLLLPDLTRLKRPDREIVRTWLTVALETFHDNAWTMQCKGLVLLGLETNRSDEEEKLHAKMFAAMFNFINTIGKWFASQGEFPASIWCHEKNVALSIANCRDDCLAHSLEVLAKTQGRQGNTLEAFRCLEQAMAIQPTEARVKDAYALRVAAKDQVGTSGRITPFVTRRVPPTSDGNGSVSHDDEREDALTDACANCGKRGHTSVATCCRLVCYCDETCQKTHWFGVHKHTCLFGKTRKS